VFVFAENLVDPELLLQRLVAPAEQDLCSGLLGARLQYASDPAHVLPKPVPSKVGCF
jgi:hypothetical protein